MRVDYSLHSRLCQYVFSRNLSFATISVAGSLIPIVVYLRWGWLYPQQELIKHFVRCEINHGGKFNAESNLIFVFVEDSVQQMSHDNNNDQ